MMIPFNKPYMTGKETEYIRQAVESGKISGNGLFTKKCQQFFEERYGFRKCLLTTSCTDALEMAAILADVGPGDEVIVPSYTFVSSALAFVRQGAKIVFCDSCRNNPNIDPAEIEKLVTPRTKVIVPVHYAGVACDMDAIMDIASRHNLLVVEDAAQKFVRRAEIIWEKGTNRAEFFRGEVNKYGWVDTGSSFLPSEIVAAFLWAQIENLESIQARRLAIWNTYLEGLAPLAGNGYFTLPDMPKYATNNAHMFYLVFPNLARRSDFIEKMKGQGILCVFHYLALHASSFYESKHDGRSLPNCDRFADCLLRLPMWIGVEDYQATILETAQTILKAN